MVETEKRVRGPGDRLILSIKEARRRRGHPGFGLGDGEMQCQKTGGGKTDFEACEPAGDSRNVLEIGGEGQYREGQGHRHTIPISIQGGYGW